MKASILKFIVLSFFITNSILLFSQNYSLVWSDEFDYTGLPASNKWSYDVGGSGWGNQELQYYTEYRSENARVEGGRLIIEARKESYEGLDYTSARLVTKYKGDWLYGRIEVNAKLPGGTGSWPAIWMLPTDWEYGEWPNSGEIDIMEHVGYDPTTIYGTVHTEAYNGMNGTQQGSNIQVNDCESNYHIYAIEWSENKIEFYVDDTKYFTFYNQNTWETWPFDKRFHLLLNIAVGGTWGGLQGVDDNIFPIKMEVDYVRVYQETTSNDVLVNNDKLVVFPSPTDSMLSLKLPDGFDILADSEIKITNANGVLVKRISLNDNIEQIDVSELPAGVYFISISNKIQILTAKFLVH